MKNKKSFFLFLLVLIFSSCAVRDYTNDTLESRFFSPTLNIISPLNNSTYYSGLEIEGYASHHRGIDRVVLDAGFLGRIVLTNSSHSTNFYFHTNISVYFSTSANLSVTAYDTDGRSTSASLYCYLAPDFPYVTILTPNISGYKLLTNASVLNVAGTAGVTLGSIDHVEIWTNFDAGSGYLADGSTIWAYNLSLPLNTESTFYVVPFTTEGTYSVSPFIIQQDSVLPVVERRDPLTAYPNDVNLKFSINEDVESYATFGIYTNTDSNTMGMITNFDTYNEIGLYFPGMDYGNYDFTIYHRDKAGNNSLPISFSLLVSPGVPRISINYTHYATTDPRPYVSGTVSVNSGTVTNLMAVQGSVTNTWGFDGAGFFSNQIPANLTQNQYTEITLIAISDSGFTNMERVGFNYDITPPVFEYVSSSSLYMGTDIYLDAGFYDDATGIDHLEVVTLGSSTNFTNTYDTGFFSSWSTNWLMHYSFYSSIYVYDDGPYTNTLILFDSAGNSNSATVVKNLYNGVYVSTNASAAGKGYDHDPMRYIDAAIAFASSNHISEVYLEGGTYDFSSGLRSSSAGITLSGISNVNVYGSYEFSSGMLMGPGNESFIDASAAGVHNCDHILSIDQSENVYFQYISFFHLTNSDVNGEGGAIHIQNSLDIDFNNVDIRYNALFGAGSKGGGVYIQDSGYIRFEDSTLAYNSAADIGGGLYATNTYYVDFNTVDILANKTAGAGGGFGAESLQNLNLYNSYFIANEASAGGAIFSKNSESVNSSYSTYQTNFAGYGGATFFENLNYVSFYYDNFSSNFATNGGCFFVQEASSVSLDNVTAEQTTLYDGEGAFLYLNHADSLQIYSISSISNWFENDSPYNSVVLLNGNATDSHSITYSTFEVHPDGEAGILFRKRIPDYDLTFNYNNLYLNSTTTNFFYNENNPSIITTAVDINDPGLLGASSATGNAVSFE